ncbi:unnamed protein product [Heterobilharzia americana]|nr:unnamed protein product [Heterobilharzia americana]
MGFMEVPYINWMKNFSVYETPSHIYLIGSDADESYFRVLKIDRSPVPLGYDNLWMDKECSGSEATVEAETLIDRIWRLNIIEDPHIYSRSEVARLLHTIQAASRTFIRKLIVMVATSQKHQALLSGHVSVHCFQNVDLKIIP